MQNPTHHTARWSSGLKPAIGFTLALAVLLVVNLFVYQQIRQLTSSCPEALHTAELLHILIVTNLLSIVVLSGLILLLNRKLTMRDSADHSDRTAHAEREVALNERISELTKLNQKLQADITQQNRVEGQLKHFQKMESLGKLIGSVGHEFNNYLTVIVGFSEQLLQQMPPGTMEHATVEEILKAGELSADLTRSLLGLVRTSDGKLRLLDVNRQVEAMRRMLHVLVGKRVRLEIVLEEGLPPVHAVPGQIEQVLLNLATNARDAMPQGGRLTIETRHTAPEKLDAEVPPGHYVTLAVSDTGCGISDETQRRMFEPFFTTKEKGTGLGLATVREIVETSHGCVVADSHPGQGATFKVYWPAALTDTEQSVGSGERDTNCPVSHSDRETLRG